MTETTAPGPRINPAREGAPRVRIEASGAGSGRGSGLTWLLLLVLVGGGLGGAFWAHREGLIEVPGLNEVLARTPLGAPTQSGERLLEAGAEPLGELRYAWADDLVVALELSVTVESALTVDGAPAAPAPQPGLRALVEARPGATSPEGARFWNFELTELTPTDASGPAELQEQLDAARAGFRGTLLVTSRGQVEQARIEFPAAAPELQPLLDQLAQTLALTLPVLPAEPIGTGARWRTALGVPGTDARLDADHELLALEENGAELETALSTGAKLPGSFSAPGLTPAAGELVAFRATGTLRRQLDLGGLVSALDGETTVELQLSGTAEDGLPSETEVVTTYRTTVRTR